MEITNFNTKNNNFIDKTNKKSKHNNFFDKTNKKSKNIIKCNCCKKLGHTSNQCFFQKKQIEIKKEQNNYKQNNYKPNNYNYLFSLNTIGNKNNFKFNNYTLFGFCNYDFFPEKNKMNF